MAKKTNHRKSKMFERQKSKHFKITKVNQLNGPLDSFKKHSTPLIFETNKKPIAI